MTRHALRNFLLHLLPTSIAFDLRLISQIFDVSHLCHKLRYDNFRFRLHTFLRTDFKTFIVLLRVLTVLRLWLIAWSPMSTVRSYWFIIIPDLPTYSQRRFATLFQDVVIKLKSPVGFGYTYSIWILKITHLTMQKGL